MSIVLEMEEGIGGLRCVGEISCFPARESPEMGGAPAVAVAVAEVSGSSSIGRNSDCCLVGGEEEVQSSFKGPLERMDALEDSLPMRRGISKFYCGKSKSFAVLSDAMAELTSAKELGKPENAYSRKRKKLLCFTNRWETGECDRSGGSKRRANYPGDAEEAPWASPLASCFAARSLSLMDLESIETLSSSSSSLSSIGYEEQKGFS